MRSKYFLLMPCLSIALGISVRVHAQTPSNASPDISVDRIIDKAIEQERSLSKRMTTMRPLIETYTQNMGIHPDLGAVPKSDKYFLGKLDLANGVHQKSLLPDSGGFISSLGQRIKQVYSVNYVPDGFAATMSCRSGCFQKVDLKWHWKLRCGVCLSYPPTKTAACVTKRPFDGSARFFLMCFMFRNAC